MLEYFTGQKSKKIAFFFWGTSIFGEFPVLTFILRRGGCNESPLSSRHCAPLCTAAPSFRLFLFCLFQLFLSLFVAQLFFRFPSFARHCSSFFSQVTMPSLHASSPFVLCICNLSLLALRAFCVFLCSSFFSQIYLNHRSIPKERTSTKAQERALRSRGSLQWFRFLEKYQDSTEKEND